MMSNKFLRCSEFIVVHGQKWIGEPMTIEEIIDQVTQICRKNHVQHLSLFGSYARGTQTRYSDIDFIVYGAKDIEDLKDQIDEIPTLKKIDIFDYDEVCSPYLREEMDAYGRKIY